MKKVFIALCILCMLAMVGWKLFFKGAIAEEKEKDLLLRSSNAQEYKENITIMGDEWLGYMVYRSSAFQNYLAESEIGVSFIVEHNFEKRFEALSKGKADLVLATADSYLVNARKSKYPGVICSIIDESFGGDALIASSKIKSIDDLNSGELKGAFVGYSPSEFLLKSQVAHFKLDQLAPRVNSFREDSAEQAYKKFKQGQVDFAVLWEPFASRALEEAGAQKLIDTSKAQDLIIDVTVASRQLAAQKPELLQKVMVAYYRALNDFQGDADLMLRQATIDSGEDKKVAQQMLSGIHFTNYKDNVTHWMDPNQEYRLKRVLNSVTAILMDVGDLKQEPPNHSALINSKILQNISSELKSLKEQNASTSLGHYFRPLDKAGWDKLSKNATGTLMERPIEFPSGSSEVDEETKAELLEASQKLLHYPYHRLIIQAHVSPGGGAETEQELSQQRAEFIKSYLIANTDITSDRIHADGLGATKALPRKNGESSRAWKRRCRRASILISSE